MEASQAPAVNIKACIFDVDGTLLDTESLSDLAILRALRLPPGVKELTQNQIPWELKSHILGLPSYGGVGGGSGWSPVVLRFFKEVGGWDGRRGGREYTASKLWGDWEMQMNELLEECRVCRGAAMLVNELEAREMPLGIATSSGGEGWSIKMQKHANLFDKFTVIVTGDDPSILHGKPAPDMYLSASDRLGVRPEECLVFEDSKAGCASAISAGCHVVAVPDRRCDKTDFWEMGCEEVLGSLEEFKGEKWGLDVDIRRMVGERKRRSRRG
ncbi:hypothetical protein TrVE_jg8974 [Triparma verrucosa]|uniref:Uncharacterized protein n=1 Tax=Triparma verrucosa TaxID=1606542 RepID=A0A9W6ZCH4_9STRA|nr:hypothetical protein TrVE_jg8974 [Triparma verrucosa]